MQKQNKKRKNIDDNLSLIFIHTGSRTPPQCMLESIAIACKVTSCRIYVLTNKYYISDLVKEISLRLSSEIGQLKFIDIESIPKGKDSEVFANSSKIDRNFRDGFWFETSNRFFLIADFMDHLQLENCLHVENDVVIYFDPIKKLEAFESFARFAIPFDRSRAIPGIVWYKDSAIAKQIAAYIAKHSEKPDFDVLREFCDAHSEIARPLPTMPLSYAIAHNLSLDNYCQGIELFDGIFDAAAIGQYLGGVHWMNNPENTRFFVNETSDLDLNECNFAWFRNKRYRYPVISYIDNYIKVLSVHAHSKDSLGVSPFNCVNITKKEDLITGEKLQSIAELTISSEEVTKFHGVHNINTQYLLEIPVKETRKLFKKIKVETPPDEEFIKKCQSAKCIFVYKHLTPYFKKYIAPRIFSPFILITHNSDDGIHFEDLDLLNKPELKQWYAQNTLISHNKLKALPIGLANSQWGSDREELTFESIQNWKKDKLLYANFRHDTHVSRIKLLEIIKQLSNITIESQVSFNHYIRELASHKFCLCPRGNGIDTHRFWEAQYLDSIPIIIQQDWTAAYSNLPILVLKSWEDLLETDLNKEYIKISSTSYDRSKLHHSVLKNLIIDSQSFL